MRASSQPFCHVYSIDVNSLTILTGVDVYNNLCGTYTVKQARWFEVSNSSEGGVMVKYLYDVPFDFRISGFANGFGSNPNDLYCLRVYKNNSKIAEAYSKRYFSSPTADQGNLFGETVETLTRGDFIELKVANETTANQNFRVFKWQIICQ